MKKIPSLFQRIGDSSLCSDIVTPGCEWVLNGEGSATAKMDGTACAVINGHLYKRYDNSRLKGIDNRIQKTEPLESWIHCGCDTERGKFIYWIPVTSKDYYHQIAWGWAHAWLEDGTYELIGPEVQGNPHKQQYNRLYKHGLPLFVFDIKDSYSYTNKPNFEIIKNYLTKSEWEGIVWHHEDGRMCKITKAKFGIPWP